MIVAGCYLHGGLSVGPCPVCGRKGVDKLGAFAKASDHMRDSAVDG